MSKILLVDDERDIVEFLQYNLEQKGYEVIVGYDGLEALKKLSENPDLIILDIMMPHLDGYDVYKKIRENEKFKNIPIIFLTAKSGEVDEIKALELGASDYVQKPISPKKLLARVKLNLRKYEKDKTGDESSILEVGPLVIDREKFIVRIDNVETIFPRKEFSLLYFLANNPGRVYNRAELLKEVWGADVFVVDRTVDVHIRKIREKLGKHSDLVETIKGVGYKFKSV
ncbi:response regulator transcription factor [bacterium BMS3Abin03]|jgi:two-component system alkaline phosphatase synthesis response regulator PhoP|nr:response regulator transcription factor [bacterium BMS3Abin03]MCG6961417.1 response regulator transcription factor [bacterium BMS3Abin03]